MNSKGNIQEMRLVEQALKSLQNHTGLKTEWIPQSYPFDTGLDGRLIIYLDSGKIELDTEIKREVRPHQLKAIVQMAGTKRPLLVIAHNILPKAKEWLRSENIAYLDVAGNFFIRHGDTWIWIEGNKVPKAEKDIPNRAFTSTGLKVLFLFLTEQNALGLPYREIANRANVALGNIPLVIKGLKDTGFLIKIDRTRYTLKQKRELLDRWIAGYNDIMRPKLTMGTFRMQERNTDWKNYELIEGDMWGGESAAELLTEYLTSEKLTLYTTTTKMALIKRYRLTPDPKGNVEVLQQFWTERQNNHSNDLVHPVIIYADLIRSQDPRNIETAEIIFERFLKPDFTE